MPPHYGLWAIEAFDDARAIVASTTPRAPPDGAPAEEQREWARARNAFSRHAISTVLLSALAVEAFLNTYGVVRLRQRFFDDNVERLNIDKKVTFLALVSTNRLLEPTDLIVVATRRLFRERNGIAHPKSKEVKAAEWEAAVTAESRKGTDALTGARDALLDMRTIFREFLIFDPNASIFMAPEIITYEPPA